ncbi:MAG TPA: hypothetical protein VLJ21_03140, partial [Candidatus Binatia bacterium]|nr:hypothetical protein [Candidatus Binatia bacterium]
YSLMVTFNNKIGYLYAVSWQEATFFTFIFVLPVLALAVLPMFRTAKSKNEFGVLALVFATVFVLQVVAMNVVYGPFNRVKLPAPIPVLALAVIFLATYRGKFAYALVAGQLLLTLFAFTPSFALPELGMADAIGTLDRCVAPDAHMVFNEVQSTKQNVPLFRLPNDYYWFLRGFYDEAGVTPTPPPFADPLSVCGSTIERSAWTCTASALAGAQQACDNLLVPDSLWRETRAFLGTHLATG